MDAVSGGNPGRVEHAAEAVNPEAYIGQGENTRIYQQKGEC